MIQINENLYNEKLLELAQSLNDHHLLFEPDYSVKEDNPLCGDRIKIRIKFSKGMLDEIHPEVKGCILCKASMAMLLNHFDIYKLSREKFFHDFSTFKNFLETPSPETAIQNLEPEKVLFNPVSPFKSRHECVLLSFKTLSKAYELCEGYPH